MSWRLVFAAAAIVFSVGVTCSPIDVAQPATELLPPFDDSVKETTDYSIPSDNAESTLATDLLPPNDDSLPTLSTDLQPPKIDSESTYSDSAKSEDDVPTPATDLLPPLTSELLPPKVSEKKVPATLFLINVFAVKNHTAEESNDVLHDDVMKEVPDETAEPLAMFLLVVEDEDESSPVSLDEVAKDLEAEGFRVEKIGKAGETRLIKVNLDSVMEKESEERSNAIERVRRDLSNVEAQEEGVLDNSGRLTKIRRKRTLCLKCKLNEMREMLGHGGCNTCGGGGGGGGYYPQPSYQQPPPQQVVYQPQPPKVVYHPQPQPIIVQQPPQPVYSVPQQQPAPYCDPCAQKGGGGGGYGPGGGSGYGHGGGGNSYSQASAQASAQASSSSYGK